MPYTNTVSGQFAGLAFRVDTDNKQWLQAHAAVSLTASAVYVIRSSTSGYVASGLFATGLASTTAVSRANYFLGIPDQNYPSACLAWLQIGGKRSSVTTQSITGTAGGTFAWASATVNNYGAGSNDIGHFNQFAICLTSASASTSHDMLLLARKTCGLG